MRINISMKALVVVAIFLFCIALIPTALTAPSKTGYANVKSHVITGSTDGALTDYQMLFVVHSGSGKDNGQDVYLNSKCLSWPNDIRFTNNEGIQLSYWIEKYDANTAYIWVKIDRIPAYPKTATIKIYYGKADDLGNSNGFNTFVVFEDFSDDARRTTVWTESYAISAGINGFTDVHKFENGGYHIKQNIKSDRSSTLYLTTPLTVPTWSTVTLEVVSEEGDRMPAWVLCPVGYGSYDGWAFGYWGGVYQYDPQAGHKYQIVWTDGRSSDNLMIYENGDLKNIQSVSYTIRTPNLGIRTANDVMGEWYYKNFYARAYTANPPTLGRAARTK